MRPHRRAELKGRAGLPFFQKPTHYWGIKALTIQLVSRPSTPPNRRRFQPPAPPRLRSVVPPIPVPLHRHGSDPPCLSVATALTQCANAHSV
jgi:hypothetical protein